MKRGIALILGAAAAAAALVGFGAPNEDDATVPTGQAAFGAPDPLGGQIAEERAWLGRHPDDATAWAMLGAAYVERARVIADPTYLTKADDTLNQTSSLPSAQTDPYVLDGCAALAGAPHRFAEAGALAGRALALRAGDWIAWGVLSDADVQLGRYERGAVGVAAMMDT